MKETMISKINESIQNGYAIAIGNTFGASAYCGSYSKFVPDGMNVYDSEIEIFNGGDLYCIPINDSIHIEYNEDENSFSIYSEDKSWETRIYL